MELKKSEFKTLKGLPLESRNILVELIKHMKITHSEKTNKLINHDDIIIFRNGGIAWANCLIEAMETEKPVKQSATLLTRQEVASKKRRNTPRLNTTTKKKTKK